MSKAMEELDASIMYAGLDQHLIILDRRYWMEERYRKRFLERAKDGELVKRLRDMANRIESDQ